MKYYKIMAIHNHHGLCTILPYDKENNIVGRSEKFHTKEEAIEAIKIAVGYRARGLPNHVNNTLMDSLGQYGFNDITIMEFIDVNK